MMGLKLNPVSKSGLLWDDYMTDIVGLEFRRKSLGNGIKAPFFTFITSMKFQSIHLNSEIIFDANQCYYWNTLLTCH